MLSWKVVGVAALLCQSVPATAKVWLDADRVYYKGQISAEDNKKLMQLYQQAKSKPTRLVIQSGGGNIDLGMDLADFVIQQQLDVEVPEFCFSSCANYVFVAGKSKWLGENAVLGWHGNAASARWLDEDIDAMVKNLEGEERQQQWLKLRLHYDQVILKATQREALLYQQLGVDPALLTIGLQPELRSVAKQQRYRGWTFNSLVLNQLGVQSINPGTAAKNGWQPKLHPRFKLMIISELSAS
ncbi:hypothetical protein EMM73_17080 [Rheinheimera sediminis]|uniref:hypothetical protein n=1 Tax=Rheinheimera sp. YQF-1 TaxID=2499626 RepID=UPI000FD6FFBF|nr:hypothetical protein [Rheinheimera sp. YQF-1]RVT44230.1 hypothetical protein EMM73_17080 [Rheinheimera sp. YQF-1]